MAQMHVPILVDWDDIKDYMAMSDIVEVVRCKDCKHYDPYDSTERFYCYYGIDGCLPNDYCSYGERREDE